PLQRARSDLDPPTGRGEREPHHPQPLGRVPEDLQLGGLGGIDGHRRLALPPTLDHPGCMGYLGPLPLVEVCEEVTGEQRRGRPPLPAVLLLHRHPHRQQHLDSLLLQIRLAPLLHPGVHAQHTPPAASAPIGFLLHHCTTRSTTRKTEAMAVMTPSTL